MEISSATAHHQKLMATGASSQMEEVVLCNSKPRQQSPASNETQAATVERKPRPHPDKAIKCPRCPSTNTKFCYYNNYSMSQPRYFCKECRRYWTEGGSLRNVPIGGGCRKNRRSSTSSSSSSSAAAASNKVNKLVPEPMVLPSCTDFPNVLPTFSSTGFELPRDHLSLAFGSSSSNPAATLAPGGTFLDILRGGLLDGNHQNNDCYGPTNAMVMPPSTTFCVGAGLNLMMQQHGLGGTADPAIIGGATATQGVVNGSTDAGEEGGGGVKAMMGLQWPSQFGGGGGGVGSAGGQLPVGGQQQQQGTVNDNNATMDDNNNGPSRDWYWNNGAADSGNPWQGLINSSSLI